MQRSKVVVHYLKSMTRVPSILDFGCGKLRYADLVARIGKEAYFVDSVVQLTRRQRVRGRMTTVARYVRAYYPNGRVVSAESLDRTRRKYDLVTCINVLSAIPQASALRIALETIRRLTKRTGMAVFVNQHRNGYFKSFRRGRRHLFGYLFEGRRGTSYYGIMTKDRVQQLLQSAGFSIRNAWTEGEINFVEAYPTGEPTDDTREESEPHTSAAHDRGQVVQRR